ncbi:MAG: hypothetical protein CMJ94_13670 [Planctomycetes bacterium]|nr:hypothetical protein [Planctomycetota bacterium]
MRCPDCREELVILEVDEVELDLCIAGHGSWFDAQELVQLFDAAVAASDAESSSEIPALEAELSQVPGETSRRRCPRCARRMKAVHWRGAGPVLDRCPQGHGLWFDPGELQGLARVSLGEDQVALRQVQEYLRAFFPDAAAPGTVDEREAEA